jgi:hypothetical protein
MNNVPPGVVCSFQDYERSLSDHSITCLTRGDSIGLTVKIFFYATPFSSLTVRGYLQVTAEAGILSLLAILYVFLIIGVSLLEYLETAPNIP